MHFPIVLTVVIALLFPVLMPPAARAEILTIPAGMKELYKRPAHIPFPDDNPYSASKAELGKILFFETRISRSGVMSCASCHNPGLEWADGNPRGTGDFHKTLSRKSTTILNLAWDSLFFLDGRAESLEQQALIPIKTVDEMNMSLEKMVQKLKSIQGYIPLFKAAFPSSTSPITAENAAKAIAIFERTVISSDAPFDRWINGDESAITRDAKKGFLLFNTKANCASCHAGWRFSDGSFHDIGINDNDRGRGKFLPFLPMQHAFKTTTLRNIDRRAPYMHNGSLATLSDVIDHYDHGFIKRESLSDEMRLLHLTLEEKKALEAFLKTLTSTDSPITIPLLPR